MVISIAKIIKLIKRVHPFKSSHLGVFLVKSRSENMHQIYRRAPMPKCDFNKIAKQFTLRHGRSSVNLLHIFRAPLLRTPLKAASDTLTQECSKRPVKTSGHVITCEHKS